MDKQEKEFNYAVRSRHVNNMKNLLKKGVNPDFRICHYDKAEYNSNSLLTESKNNTALHIFTSDNSDVEGVCILLKHNADPNIKNICNKTNLEDATPLHFIVKSCKNDSNLDTLNKEERKNVRIRKLHLLVSKKADVCIQDIEGRTPLHWAIIYKQDDIARILLHYAVKKCHGIASIEDKYGETPSNLAKEKGMDYLFVNIDDYFNND